MLIQLFQVDDIGFMREMVRVNHGAILAIRESDTGGSKVHIASMGTLLVEESPERIEELILESQWEMACNHWHAAVQMGAIPGFL